MIISVRSAPCMVLWCTNCDFVVSCQYEYILGDLGSRRNRSKCKYCWNDKYVWSKIPGLHCMCIRYESYFWFEQYCFGFSRLRPCGASVRSVWVHLHSTLWWIVMNSRFIIWTSSLLLWPALVKQVPYWFVLVTPFDIPKVANKPVHEA